MAVASKEIESHLNYGLQFDRPHFTVIQGQQIKDPQKVIDEKTREYVDVAGEIWDYFAGREMRKGVLSSYAKHKATLGFIGAIVRLDSLRNTLTADQLAQIAGTNPEMIVNYQEKILRNPQHKSA